MQRQLLDADRVVLGVHLRRGAIGPAPQLELHRGRVVDRSHHCGRVLHFDMGDLRGEGKIARRLL